MIGRPATSENKNQKTIWATGIQSTRPTDNSARSLNRITRTTYRITRPSLSDNSAHCAIQVGSLYGVTLRVNLNNILVSSHKATSIWFLVLRIFSSKKWGERAIRKFKYKYFDFEKFWGEAQKLKASDYYFFLHMLNLSYLTVFIPIKPQLVVKQLWNVMIRPTIKPWVKLFQAIIV